jgi:hypothetical protein
MGPIVELFGWLHLLPSIAGFAISLASLGRSRWAAVLTLGFGAQVLAQLFYRVASRLFVGGLMRPGGAGAGLAMAGLIGLLGAVAIVVGVAGLLREGRSSTSVRP